MFFLLTITRKQAALNGVIVEKVAVVAKSKSSLPIVLAILSFFKDEKQKD